MQAQEYYPTASYIPGQDNINCGFSIPRPRSPLGVDSPPPGHAMILRTFGPLHVDLFASVLNAQLRRYCTKTLDPAMWRLDAFSFRWEGFTDYAFPPISIIPRILQKVRQDRATILLIAPWWPKRTWFLDMTTPVVGYPRILPAHRDMISQPISGTLHPRLAALHLTAWPLSRIQELYKKSHKLAAQEILDGKVTQKYDMTQFRDDGHERRSRVVSHWPDSQRDVPARSSPGPRGLMRGYGSGGGPSGGLHLTGPQLAIPGRSSPDPRGSIAGSGVGGVPPVGITTQRPGPQGANAAGHTGWILPPKHAAGHRSGSLE